MFFIEAPDQNAGPEHPSLFMLGDSEELAAAKEHIAEMALAHMAHYPTDDNIQSNAALLEELVQNREVISIKNRRTFDRVIWTTIIDERRRILVNQAHQGNIGAASLLHSLKLLDTFVLGQGVHVNSEGLLMSHNPKAAEQKISVTDLHDELGDMLGLRRELTEEERRDEELALVHEVGATHRATQLPLAFSEYSQWYPHLLSNEQYDSYGVMQDGEYQPLVTRLSQDYYHTNYKYLRNPD